MKNKPIVLIQGVPINTVLSPAEREIVLHFFKDLLNAYVRCKKCGIAPDIPRFMALWRVING